MGLESMNPEQGFPSSCRNPASSAVGSHRKIMCAAKRKKEKNIYCIHHPPPPRVLASQRMDHAKTSMGVSSISPRVLAAKFEGRTWPVSRGMSRLSRESMTCFCINFFFRSEIISHVFCSAKKNETEIDQASRPKRQLQAQSIYDGPQPCHRRLSAQWALHIYQVRYHSDQCAL